MEYDGNGLEILERRECIALMAAGFSRWPPEDQEETTMNAAVEPHPGLEDRPVAAVMATDLLTITLTDSVLMAWELMSQAQVRHLPVVDHAGHYLGVATAQTISSTWEPGGPDRARRPITSVLPTPCPSPVGPAATLRTAAQAMLRDGVDFVAVVDEDRTLVGLVTAHDLISALAGTTAPQNAPGSNKPSLYRIEPVIPEVDHPPIGHKSVISPG